MTFETVRLDSSSEPELKRAAYDAFMPGYHHGRIEPSPIAFEAFESMLWSRPGHVGEGFLALRDDVPLGLGTLILPQLDNREMAMSIVSVLPDHRRQGVGSTLYNAVETTARQRGRRILVSEVDAPPDEADSAPGIGFATAMGFDVVLTQIVRRLRLPVSEERLAALEEKVAAAADAYRIESWTDVCPEEYLDQYAELCAALSTEAPRGDFALEPEVWDAERVRTRERHDRETGTTRYTSVAVAPDGTLAAHTIVTVSRDHGGHGSQDDTLVRPEHRGRRLGLAVKVANLREVQGRQPELVSLRTRTAEVNAAMIRVNEQLGFEPIESGRVLQRML